MIILRDINLDVDSICFDIYKGKHDDALLNILEKTEGSRSDWIRERTRQLLHTHAWLRLEVLTNPGSK